MKVYMLSDYLKETYGNKIYKLLLSSGMTCPNRDGTCGSRGCIFCSEKGSGEFAVSECSNIDTQIELAKGMLSHKEKAFGKFIAYFQAFSNTYSSADEIEKFYLPVVMRDDIAILDIATRPDCLSDKVIDVLCKLNEIKPVWIELGLQTINEQTAQYIRRGYPLSLYEEVSDKLRSKGINIITHLILGLPGEDKEDMIKSAKLAARYSNGLKFHMLFVLKGTDLEKEYNKGKLDLLERDEYIDILCDCIRHIPDNIVIHRLTGDPSAEALLAPTWSLEKVKVLREINNAFYDKDVIQGEYAKLV